MYYDNNHIYIFIYIYIHILHISGTYTYKNLKRCIVKKTNIRQLVKW